MRHNETNEMLKFLIFIFGIVYINRLLMMDKKTCPKHVEFYSKNKFEKLEHLFGFIIRISQLNTHQYSQYSFNFT